MPRAKHQPFLFSAVFRGGALALLMAVSAFGCQAIAGLSDYEIAPGPATGSGTGGQGGTGSTSSDTTSTTSEGGSGGQGGAPECEDKSDCGADTTCLSYLCNAGTCETNKAVVGTTCTEGGVVCDGQGMCVAANCFDTVLNNDETDVDCGGSCSAKCANGDDCSVDDDCESTYCYQSGGPPGVCVGTQDNGSPCNSAAECSSDFCTDGVCCLVDSCLTECLSCAVPGLEGQCNIYEGKACNSSLNDECTAPDTCDDQGACQPNHVAAGTSCGSLTPGSCDLADSCDGAGKCDPNYLTAGTPCGSSATSGCDDGDSCNASGVCLTNNHANGSACGGTCSDTLSTPSGTCSNGACSSTTTDCAPYACKAAGTGCETTCSSAAQCESTGFCGIPPGNPGHCTACGGGGPGMPACSVGGVCETCPNSTCQKVCNVGGECSAAITLTATNGPALLDCQGQCAGITVTCQGPWACTVHCGPGGCAGLTLNCDPEGPCTLDCDAGACSGTVTQNCEQNQCTATCGGAFPITQNPGPSCDASKTGCL